MSTPSTKQEVLDLIREKTNILDDVRTQAVAATMNKNKSLAESLKEQATTMDNEIMRLKLELRDMEDREIK